MLSFLENKLIKRLLLVGAVFFVCLIILSSLFFGFVKYYENKFYPGVKIANTDLGGKSIDEAKKILQDKLKIIDQEGTKFIFNNNEVVITPTISSFEIDLAQQVIVFDKEKSLKKAMQLGRSNDFFTNINDIIKLIFNKQENPVFYEMQEDIIKNNLEEIFQEFEIPAQDATLATSSISLSDKNEISFSVKEEKYGKIINYNDGLDKFKKQLSVLDNSDINLTSITDYPTIYKKDCLNIESSAQKLISKAPLILKYNDKEWTLEKEQIANLLSLELDEEENIYVGLGEERMKKYLEEIIAPEVNKEPIDAKFEISNGRVTEFQASSAGVEINIPNSTKKINQSLIHEDVSEVELIVDETNSTIGTEEVNDMGVKEVIGTGYSNFAGSPANRRHNILTGSNSVKGILIAPEEEFSLIDILGDINASTGYLPELVIKGNETIPEYGGGLCQVATTIFRAALAAGLEITARRNHSYRVSYYEPAGTDAAVYDPWPNVKFKNDTKNHILIQTKMEGNELYYDIWGTNDGRVASTTYPVIYNIVRPAPTKIIETLNLEPGVRKCTESAHNGADAYFDYTVTYPDRETKERRFHSHYVPWQEVCLLGVEKLSEDDSDESSDNNSSSEDEQAEKNEVSEDDSDIEEISEEKISEEENI